MLRPSGVSHRGPLLAVASSPASSSSSSHGSCSSSSSSSSSSSHGAGDSRDINGVSSQRAATQQLLVQLAVAVAYAGFTLGALRVRSWRFRHRVSFKVLNTGEIEGIRELVQSEDADEEGSEIDSLLSPFSRDLLVGIQVDGDVVGIDTINVDGETGYLEEVKLARQFWGYGLEQALRSKTLEVVSSPNKDSATARYVGNAASVSRVRQLVFAWNHRARAICAGTGMKEIARWSYLVADESNKAEALLKRVDRAVHLQEFSLPELRQVTRVSKMMAVLERTSQGGLLLQYWDIYDVRRDVLVSLFSGVLANSPRHRDSDSLSPNTLIDHNPHASYSHTFANANVASGFNTDVTTTRQHPYERGVDSDVRISYGSNSGSDEDLLGPEDLPRTHHMRNCVMQLADRTCSIGELIDRDEPLGSLCTFTIYCSEDAVARNAKACRAEALAHIRYWANLGLDMHCKSIAMFCSPALHGELAGIVDLKQASQLILFQKSF